MNNKKMEERPWGRYEILFDSPTYKVKKITVNPSSRLSLQSHNHRCEHWICVKGNGIARINNDEIELCQNTRVFIDFHDIHRLSNTSDTDLVIIEVQQGSYLGEDDIKRYEDDYNRK
jgi:mannose-6-phosphate isomerase-like protein (cupin superfamily)